MPRIATDIRIFLSSTFLDLRDLRQEISRRLVEVFGAHLITMETFGSDDAPPDVTSVRRVRESDIFVGIYTRRYGTIDPATGKSITELELEEAERALSAGILTGIFLYVLDDDAPWDTQYSDTDPVAVSALQRLKERIRHTVTIFRSAQDLPYYVIRDVLARLRDRLGSTFPRLRSIALPQSRSLERPIGMEFLKSSDRQYLLGRDEKITELLECLHRNSMTLLLGNSGCGKTSLIHAGLFPRAIERGWTPVYARPLGFPQSDIVAALQTSVFEGQSSYRGSLIPLLDEIAVALESQRLLLVVDQFEDILVARDTSETERLITDLRTAIHLEQPNVRILISYRADLEARLGHYWQQISGSPEGLPRVYLGGIDAYDAWRAIKTSAQDLGVRLVLTPSEEDDIRQGLIRASRSLGETGVYPPYIQMFIDHVWRSVQGNASYQLKHYEANGGMEGVVGGYLGRQLAYADDRTGHVRAVLVALVRSYGVKAQRPLSEIAAEVGLPESQCEEVLERLIDLRLVRHIENQYEIAHDFLAREISAKLVDSEEREFKRFRELLTTKAATFSTTGAVLTSEELLALFKYNERVLTSEVELRLILASWAQGAGPGLCWLLPASADRLLEWIGVEEQNPTLGRAETAMLALLRRRIGRQPLREQDWAAFRDYQLATELSGLLTGSASECSETTIMWGLRSKHRQVRAAALEVTVSRINRGEWKWIARLRNSSSDFLNLAYEQLVLHPDVPCPPDSLLSAKDKAIREFALLQNIANSRSPAQAARLLRMLRAWRPRARSLLFASGLVTFQSKGIRSLLSRGMKLGSDKIGILLRSVRGKLNASDFRALLGAYKRFNNDEAQHMDDLNDRLRQLYERKAAAVAEVILSTVSTRHLNPLRQALQAVALTPSAQTIALALIRCGGPRDIFRVAKRITEVPYRIEYWHQIEVSYAAAKRMTKVARTIPVALRQICERNEFWERLDSNPARGHDLPLKESSNRTLYVRLVAHALIGAAQQADVGLLCRLAKHEYRMIARAAAFRLTAVCNGNGLRILQSTITQNVRGRNARSLAMAIRDAEIQDLGLARLW